MSGQELEPGPWRRDHGRMMLTELVFQGFLSLFLYSASHHTLTLLPPPYHRSRKWPHRFAYRPSDGGVFSRIPRLLTCVCYIDTNLNSTQAGWKPFILSLKCGHRLSRRIYLEPGDGTGVQASPTMVSTLPAEWPFAGGFNKKQMADCIPLSILLASLCGSLSRECLKVFLHKEITCCSHGFH